MESSAFASLRQYSTKVGHRKRFPERFHEWFQERFKLLPVVISVARHPARSVAQYGKYRNRAADNNLCEECAKYDWEYFFRRHLDLSCDGFNMLDGVADARKSYRRLGFPGSFSCSIDPYKDEIKDKLHFTLYFVLCSLEAMLKNKDCSLCSFALSSITTRYSLEDLHSRMSEGDWGQPLQWESRSPRCPWQPYQLSLTIRFRTQKIEDEGDGFGFYLLEDSVAKGDEARPIGRIIENNGGQVSQTTMQTWFTKCGTFHRGICVPSTNAPPMIHDDLKDDDKLDQFYVIDVGLHRVVAAPPRCCYITLSYVWGRSKFPSLPWERMLNVNRDPGRRSDSQSYLPLVDIWEEIPKTIRDAAMVVKLLGVTYLWVDSLCIAQDYPAEKTRMIEKMDQIYAKAMYCIVAGSGKDADAGLGGLHPGSRHSEQTVGNVKGYNFVSARPPIGVVDRYQPWRSRGWTFQEQKLSSNLLYFVSDHAYHVCRCATWSEDLTDGANTIGLVRHAWQENYDRTKPQNSLFLSQYADAVAEYTLRSLTFPQDKIAAFAGFLNDYAKKCGTKTCWGLPMNDFTHALLWVGSAQKQIGEGFGAFINNEKPRNSGFPTWSWASYDGPVDYGYWKRRILKTPAEISWPWDASYQQDEPSGSGAPYSTLSTMLGSGILVFMAETVTMGPRFPGKAKRRMLFEDQGMVLQDQIGHQEPHYYEGIFLGVHHSFKRANKSPKAVVLVVSQDKDGFYRREGLHNFAVLQDDTHRREEFYDYMKSVWNEQINDYAKSMWNEQTRVRKWIHLR